MTTTIASPHSCLIDLAVFPTGDMGRYKLDSHTPGPKDFCFDPELVRIKQTPFGRMKAEDFFDGHLKKGEGGPCNATLMEWLLKNQDAIPEGWRYLRPAGCVGGTIFFFGTVYVTTNDPGGEPYRHREIRGMVWDEDRCRWYEADGLTLECMTVTGARYLAHI